MLLAGATSRENWECISRFWNSDSDETLRLVARPATISTYVVGQLGRQAVLSGELPEIVHPPHSRRKLWKQLWSHLRHKFLEYANGPRSVAVAEMDHGEVEDG